MKRDLQETKHMWNDKCYSNETLYGDGKCDSLLTCRFSVFHVKWRVLFEHSYNKHMWNLKCYSWNDKCNSNSNETLYAHTENIQTNPTYAEKETYKRDL